jgi:ankyrin repeat protein
MTTRFLFLFAATLSLQAASLGPADAAERRDTNALRAMVAQKSAINTPQPDGTTALHWAAHWGDLDTVKLLLRVGADAKAANRFGATPLSEAAQAGNAAIVTALLDAGADPKTLATRDGESVLMTAARAGDLDTVKVLIARGADVNARETYRGQTALMWAAAERHADVVQYLLAHGADWKARSLERDSKMPKLSAASSVTPMARGGLTALHFAAREGDETSARALLDAGADINITDADGTTALTVSIMNKQYSFAKLLLDRGADPNLADSRGRTPLYAAIDARNEDYSALPSRKGTDPLPDIQLIQALLDRGANPNLALSKNLPGRSGMDAGDTSLDQGSTPLMRAARAGDVAVMKMLVAKGADIKQQTRLGNDVLLFAAGVGYRDKNTFGDEAGALDAVKFALSQGMDIRHKNGRGETALHGAAYRGADSIAKFLVEQGAPMDEKSNQGLTALDYAMGKNVTSQLPVPHESTVALLRKLGASEGKLEPQSTARKD